MKCPQCGTENSDKTWQCPCGHYFVSAGPASLETTGEATDAVRRVHQPDDGAGRRFASDYASTDQSTLEPPLAPAAPIPSEPINTRLSFHGDGSTLFSIHLANIIFTICTLGIYYFWGKAKVRRYVYGQTELAGDRFDYHGTGKELMLGSFKAMLLFGGTGLLYQLMFGASSNPVFRTLSVLLFYAMLALIIPIAIVGTQRFRLSRTSWRSIRFSFRGHARELITQYVRDMLFMMITLSLYYPFFQNNLRKFVVFNSYFGSQPFDYDGEGWDLFRYFALMLLLIIPTFGLYWFWYTAQKHRYYWEHTSFGQAKFRSTMRGGELAGIKISNFFLIIFTMGLAYPWAVARSVRYQVECLTMYGPVNLDSIFQQASAATATGEGLVDMLDAGILDIDFGF